MFPFEYDEGDDIEGILLPEFPFWVNGVVGVHVHV